MSGVCIDLERTTAELEELQRQHKDYVGSATTEIEILRHQLQDSERSMEEAALETCRLAQELVDKTAQLQRESEDGQRESARLLAALELERRKPTATVDDVALSDLRRQLQKSSRAEADVRQRYQAACRGVEALEAELGRVRHDMANEKTKSVNAITALLAENDELRCLMEEFSSKLQAEETLEEDLYRTRGERESAQMRTAVLERAVYVLEEAILKERAALATETARRIEAERMLSKPVTQQSTTQTRAVLGRSKHHVLSLDDMELANTRLVSAMGLPNIVDVHISRIALTLFDGTTRLVSWPLKHVKRWGVRDGVCSVVFGALSDHPGTLAFPGTARAKTLFLVLRHHLMLPEASVGNGIYQCDPV